ncbi:MAG TPA: hypothetical protein VHS31_04340 [Tepidisphaeraceae bacterium]|jgi:DNA topoisomerase-1|nr:hypothetical protein [Tepidisphaeraceae bacterium]
MSECESVAAAKRNVKCAIDEVAGQLGNTAAVCRKCYIHPEVIESYLDGTLANAAKKKPHKATARRGLTSEEIGMVSFLQNRTARVQEKE